MMLLISYHVKARPFHPYREGRIDLTLRLSVETNPHELEVVLMLFDCYMALGHYCDLHVWPPSSCH